MPLRLREVPAAHGLRWMSDGIRLFLRRPFALTLMLFLFMGLAVLVLQLPWLVGVPLVMMAPPLLSLGLMVAGQSVLLDGPVHPRQFIEPLRTDARRRNAVLLLCAGYGVAMALLGWAAFALGGDDARQLVAAMTSRAPGGNDTQRIAELMAAPGMRSAATLFNIGVMLLSVPFWHAPALVHWGQQGAAQALFSSTVALWRAKWAFTLYGAAWAGASLMVTTVATLLTVMGLGLAGLMLALVLALAATAAFYVSVLFTFNDSFGGNDPPAGPAP